MSRFRSQVLDGVASTLEFLRSTQEAYEGAGRLGMMRLGVLLVLLAEVFASLELVVTVGGRAIDLDVCFGQSFPSNMLVVRNESGDELENVTLMIENRYVLKVGSNAP